MNARAETIAARVSEIDAEIDKLNTERVALIDEHMSIRAHMIGELIPASLW